MGWFRFFLLTFACLFCFNLNIEARNVAVNRTVQLKHVLTEIGLSGEEPPPKAADSTEMHPTSNSTAAEARNVAVSRAVQHTQSKTEIGVRSDRPPPRAADTAETYPALDSKATGTANIKPDNTSIPVTAQENLDSEPK